MDPQDSAQDILRCDICETPVPPMYCDICHIKLCILCVGVHLSDQSKKHEVVPFEKRGSTTKCPKHSTKICDLHCEQCDVPICSQCVSSGKHLGHKAVEIMKILINKKEIIKKDLQEIEELIYPKYQETASDIPVQKANARKHTQKLTTALKKQGKALHQEIDNIIQKMQTEIDDMDCQHLVVIQKQEDAINQAISEIESTILDLRNLLETCDVCLVSGYKSRNEEFRKMPAQFQVSLPTLTPQKINTEQIYQQLGSLSKLAIKRKEHSGPMKTLGFMSSLQSRKLIDVPRILTDINTEYGEDNKLRSVSYLNDSEFWTCGGDKILRLYNIQGELLKSLQTKTGNMPLDITVTHRRELVYIDYNDRSINIVKNTQIQPLIRLPRWKPLYLCTSSSGDILIAMVSNDKKQAKVVRYSGPLKIQTIQMDDQGQPLYSSSTNTKYLTENRNLDICMADFAAYSVVVVNVTGKFRFRYTGLSSIQIPSNTKKPFKPSGITSDSQSRILTTDSDNHCIHILDKDGNFLRYIDNCGLQCPAGLCMDSRDHLFVAEWKIGKVKKIQY
uniref:Uncharacterized protein LOC111106114 n=1 Tax=Crassostrea virginica TaxID=6565 RepID=A0A8B8B161_CRAVI|nr:uncharacterized protein LOC111106114 [Crassostrea virginica]